MIRMAIEFIGGPLDGHFQQVAFEQDRDTSDRDTLTECRRTVMALIGKDKQLATGQRVAIYSLADNHGRLQYRFQGETIYSQ